MSEHEEHEPRRQVCRLKNPLLSQDRIEFGDSAKTGGTYQKNVQAEEQCLR